MTLYTLTRRVAILSLAGLFASCWMSLRLMAASSSTEGELLVKWRDGPRSEAAAAGNGAIGATVKRNFDALGWQLVALPPGLSVPDALEKYRTLGTVLAVEANRAMEPLPPPKDSLPADEGTRNRVRPHGPSALGPNDPMYAEQWYLPMISAPTAWATSTGSEDVIVAVIDSGVDYTHPDLAANMWRNPGETGLDDQGRDKASNGVDDDGNGYVDDVYGVNVVEDTGDPMDAGNWESPWLPESARHYHGTFVAGILGAVGNNNVGIAGVNWSVRIMAIRMTSGDSSESTYITGWKSRHLAALDYVLAMKRRGVNIRVTNNSNGGADHFGALGEAYAALGDEGILSVCAAGNNGVALDLFSFIPAGLNVGSVISVAATTASDQLADFSNYGKSNVDLAAPGDNVTSTWRGAAYMNGGRGTSFSSPMVAGAAALLWAVNPTLDVDGVKAALFGSVDQPTSLRGKVVTNGRLNIARALEYLGNPDPPAIVITSLPAGRRTTPDAAVEVTFNRPMNRPSVENAFSLTPPVIGSFEWAEDSRSFSYRHETPFDHEITYAIKILGTAQDAIGGTLDGDFDRNREGSPADDFRWTFRLPISNDDFADAQRLVGEAGSVTGNNRYAWNEGGDEPRTVLGDWRAYGSSLWYRWTAPEPGGWTTFDLTGGTTFNSLLIVCTGDQLGRLTPLAANDDYGTRTSSRASVFLAAGTTVSVVVASKGGPHPDLAGSFRLSWYPTPPPGFTGTSFSPASGAPGAMIQLSGTNFTGVTAVSFNGAKASFVTRAGDFSDLRLITYVPPEATSGPITLETPHGNGTSAGTFTVLPLDPRPPSVARITARAATESEQSSTIIVTFDQPLDQASAEATGNYRIDDGAVVVASASLRPDLKSVILSTAPLHEGESHVLAIKDVVQSFRPESVMLPVSLLFQANHLLIELSFDDPADRGANLAGGANGAELINEPRSVPGAVGQALNFDGSGEYLEVAHSDVFDITADLTIAAWVRRDSFLDYGGILAKASGLEYARDYDLFFSFADNTLRFHSDGFNPREVASTNSIANRNWNHVAVTLNGTNVTFYINGEPSGTATVTGRLPTRPFPVQIGTDGSHRDFLYRGQIDQVRLYSKALSAAEIVELARPGMSIAVTGSDIVLTWPATGIPHVLEESDAPNSGTWLPIAQGPVVQNGQYRYSSKAGVGNRFYRLRAN